MADFIISSLRGGLNEDPPTSIGEDQCTIAKNVEFWNSRLGERRRGMAAIDYAGSDLEDCNTIMWVHRHLPSDDLTEAQLWVIGVHSITQEAVVCYKDTSWHTVVPDDDIDMSLPYRYQIQGLSLHGKLFIAYKSDVDRLHVWDGTSLRRTGLAEPLAAPTGADNGSGTFSNTRYYRVRWKSSAQDLRSEPSAILTFAPSGSGSGVTVTRPATTGSDLDTDQWELEASLDGVNFYLIATTAIGTTTATDTQSATTGYAIDFELSDDIGDYENIPSVKFLCADQDRLMGGGSFEDAAFGSRIVWTPVFGDPGIGNDERIPVDTDNFLDLDNYDGGHLTGLSATVNGYVYATKYTQTYQLVRTGQRTAAYDTFPITKKRGAVPYSIVDGLDNAGNPTVFMLDPDIGPCVIGERGVESCGLDIKKTWSEVWLGDGVFTPAAAARGIYYPAKKQVIWCVTVDQSSSPNFGIVLHTQEMRATPEGYRGGWVTWTGRRVFINTTCLFSENINDDTARSTHLKPIVGISLHGGTDFMLYLTDDNTAVDDGENNSDPILITSAIFLAEIVSRPLVHGNLLNEFTVLSAILIAKASDGTTVDARIEGNFGLLAEETSNIDLSPDSLEDRVIRKIDDLSMAELTCVQVSLHDEGTPGGQWSIDLFGIREAGWQKAP